VDGWRGRALPAKMSRRYGRRCGYACVFLGLIGEDELHDATKMTVAAFS